MAGFKDITGQRFGQLVAVRRDGYFRKEAGWLCQCDCGGQKTIRGSFLRRGVTKSCGCAKREIGLRVKTHGMAGSSTYTIWNAMLSRCTNPKDPGFVRYGGRGIAVCARWLRFDHFFEDMGKRPDGKSLERINNNLGYSKSNCRWGTATEQANNRRSNTLLTAFGKTQTAAMWAREVKIPVGSIYARLWKLGWSTEDALTRPIDVRLGPRVKQPQSPPE